MQDEGIDTNILVKMSEYSSEKLLPKIGERTVFMQKIETLHQEVWAGCTKGKNRASAAGRGILINRYHNMGRKVIKVGAIGQGGIETKILKHTVADTDGKKIKTIRSIVVGQH